MNYFYLLKVDVFFTISCHIDFNALLLPLLSIKLFPAFLLMLEVATMVEKQC